MKDLGGKVAVVTGGASGIGLAMARAFAAEGMRLVLADLDEDGLAAAADELATGSADASTVTAVTDVSDPEAVERLRDRAIESFGAVHVVCNNAGVGGSGLSWEVPLEQWRWVMGVNFFGVVHGIRSFVPLLVAQNEGHIVNTASAAGLVTTPFMAPYTASKHAVVATSETLKMELSGHEVGVSVLCPMWVRTRIDTSSRNAPPEVRAALGRSEDGARQGGPFAEVIAGLVRSGLDPAVVAARVVEAVKEDRFWVLPHPEVASGARARGERIASGRPPEFNPASLTPRSAERQGGQSTPFGSSLGSTREDGWTTE